MRRVIAALATAERVSVRLPNWLGDALMARPFLHALRAAAPRARVTALGPAALLDLLGADRLWDDAVPWPPAGAPRGLDDVAFVLPPSFSSALAAWRSGARLRVGFACDARSPLLSLAVPRPARGERHLACEFLALLGAPPAAPPEVAELAPSAAGLAEAATLPGGAPGERIAIVAPGAAYGPAKRWAPARFAKVARALGLAGLRVLACGGAGDRAACDTVAAGGSAVSLAGRTSLGAQLALCARAEVVVSNDSGLAHLAAASGAPTVVVFGSTSSAWTAPLGARVRVVQRAPVCSPCFRRTCSIGYRCLEAVEVSFVMDAVVDARRESRGRTA